MMLLDGDCLIFRFLQLSESLVEKLIKRKNDNAADEENEREVWNTNLLLPSLLENQERDYPRERQKHNPRSNDEGEVRSGKSES
jgi:hypothetical protein